MLPSVYLLNSDLGRVNMTELYTQNYQTKILINTWRTITLVKKENSKLVSKMAKDTEKTVVRIQAKHCKISQIEIPYVKN